MDDLIDNAPDLIESVGDSYVRLIAFVVLVIVVPVFCLSQDFSSPDRLKVVWSLLAFGSFCVAAVLIATETAIPSMESFSLLRSLSLTNWIGLWLGGIGFIELVSSVRSGLGIQVNPGFPLFLLGSGMFFWDTSDIDHLVELGIAVMGRSFGCFGVSLIIEELLFSRYPSLRFGSDRAVSICVGMFLIAIWLLIRSLRASF